MEFVLVVVVEMMLVMEEVVVVDAEVEVAKSSSVFSGAF